MRTVVERADEMKKVWEVKRLGEVCNRTSNVNWKREKAALKYVDLSSVSRETLSITEHQIVDFKNAPSRAKKIIYKDDVIFATTRPTLKKVAVVNDDYHNCLCSTGFVVLRGKSTIVTPQWIFRYLQTEEFIDYIAISQKGASYPAVSDNDVKDVRFPLPPLPEQKRIVAVLNKAFAAIDKAKANAVKNLANAKDLFESYLNGVFSTTDEHGLTRIREGWEEKRLGDETILKIVDGDRGKNYPTKKDFMEEGFCLFMNTKNVRPDGFDFNSKMFISEFKDASMGKGKLVRGDVVMTTRGTIGNLGVYDNDVKFGNIRINSGMLIFRPNHERITSTYLFEILRSRVIKSQITKHVSGAAQPQLPIKTLINFKLPVPKSINAQKRIVARLDVFSSESKKLEQIYNQKIAYLDELKKSILRKAFEGEV